MNDVASLHQRTLRQLDKPAWASYLRALNAVIAAAPRPVWVEVHVVTTLGLARASRWQPVLDLTYDAETDTLSLSSYGYTHRVERPIALFAFEEERTPVRLIVIQLDGGSEEFGFLSTGEAAPIDTAEPQLEPSVP